MQQYHRMKAEHPDALLLLPHGRLLRAVLRRRGGGRAGPRDRAHLALEGPGAATPIPMCGVPHHAASAYIARLVQAGLPRGAVRADGGPAHGEGRGEARGRAGRHPGTQLEAAAARRRRDLVRAGARRRERTGASARPGSTPPPASSWPRSGTAPARWERCATSFGASRPRELLVPAAPPPCRLAQRSGAARGGAARAPSSMARASTRDAARRELLAHFGVLTSRPSAARTLPAATPRRRRAALRARDAEARPRPRHGLQHAPRRRRPGASTR